MKEGQQIIVTCPTLVYGATNTTHYQLADGQRLRHESSGAAKDDANKSDDLDHKLLYCVLPEAQYSKYSSFDGRKSALNLLKEKCLSEWVAWVKACKNAGDTEGNCMVKSAVIAQAALKSFGK